MYNKAFKYIPSLSVFNTLKISAVSNDSSYTIGDSAIVIGKPDISWANICFIENEGLIWTHGIFYNTDDIDLLTDEEILDLIPVEEDEEEQTLP